MSFFRVKALAAAVLLWNEASVSTAFTPLVQNHQPGGLSSRNHHHTTQQQQQQQQQQRPQRPPSLSVLYAATQQKREPSKVTDDDGPTPDLPVAEMEELDVNDVPELRDFADASEMPPGPIPHQPWRRGETDGCEDPITAEWRVEAEDIMTRAAKLVGGKVEDITWYLTSVVVTLNEDLSGAQDLLKSSGPVIEVDEPGNPIFYDPADPKPDDIWTDEDDIVYQRETEDEAQERMDKKRNMYATTDDTDPEDEPHIPEGEDDTDRVSLYMNEETRSDAAFIEAEEAKRRYDEEERPVELQSLTVDKAALSTVAGAMLEALEDAEPELRVLSRHELVLTSPGPPDVLETQKQFNAHRGHPVIVETQDPWQSNRVLKGKLLDRNAMDVLINKKGRMVTIPLNFVKCVRVMPPKESSEFDFEEGDEEEEMEEAEQP